MRKDHNKSWIRFDSLCQKLGENPKVVCREFITDTILRDKSMKSNPDERSHVFTLSTPGTKRDGNEIDQNGWKTANYRNNPVVLWAHDSKRLPIAQSMWEDLKKVKGKMSLVGEARFIPNDHTDEHSKFANKVYEMLTNGYLNTVSVGWVPLKYEMVKDEQGYYTGMRFLENDLLEYSVVPVPADPGAIKHEAEFLRSFGSDFKMTELEDIYVVGLADSEEVERETTITIDLGALPTPIINEVETNTATEAAVRTVIPYRKYKVSAEGSWSAADAKKRIANWAANADGEINYSKYRMGFIWENSADNKHSQSDYKGPHHDIEDGDMVTAKRGVYALAQRLQQGAFDVPLGELNGMKQHAAEHYGEWGEKAPWERSLGKTYEDVQLKIKECTDEDELKDLREMAVTLATKIYGQERLCESWEQGYIRAIKDTEYSAVAEQLDILLREFITDSDDRIELVVNAVRAISKTLKVREESVRILREINEITKINSASDLITQLRAKFVVEEVKTQATEPEMDFSAALERLNSIGNVEIVHNERIIENKSLTVEADLKSIIDKLINDPPVAG